MTDKVQRIREEVVRMHSLLPVMDGDNISVNYADRICTTLEMYIDSLQEEPKECMYTKDHYTDEDRKVLCDGCEEECRFNKKEESVNNGLDLGCGVIWKDEEPVSEDLEKFAYQSGYAAYPVDMAEEFGGVIRDNNRYQRSSYIKGLKAGAKWQKQQMMAEAVDAVVKIDAGGYPYVDRTIELYDYDKDIPLAKKGDKYKVILIKED